MNKWLALIAFSVLLLVPVGAQNAFAQLCPLIPGCTTGNLYVGDDILDTVSQYNSAGTLLDADFITGLAGPGSIAFDSAGNIYVTDISLGTVRQYNSAGTLLDADFITSQSNPISKAFDFTFTDDQVVGGTLLPLDTTVLILAGAQTFSWMIPVVLSVLGIGLFVVSRKSE